MEGYCNQYEVIRRTDEAIERGERYDWEYEYLPPPQPSPQAQSLALIAMRLLPYVTKRTEAAND